MSARYSSAKRNQYWSPFLLFSSFGGGGNLGHSCSSGVWMFRDLVRSHLVLSLHPIGPFATWYFSHLIDPSRFATTMFFAASAQLWLLIHSLLNLTASRQL